MKTLLRIASGVAALLVPALATAQEANTALRASVVCAPAMPSDAGDAPRIVGMQDTQIKSLFGTRDLLIVNGGTDKGLQLGQKYASRRIVSSKVSGSGWDAQVTSGLLTIVAVNERSAIASVDFACDGIERGDYLVAWTPPAIPPNADRTDAGGELDFSSPARVLFGDYGRSTAGTGDLVVIDLGQEDEVVPGARFAIYRDLQTGGIPLAAIGEAVVISVTEGSSVVRLTRTIDAIQTGDLLIPRKR